MKKILITGASGVLGLEILKLLSPQDYFIRALIRDPAKKEQVAPYCQEVFIGDATDPASIRSVCEDIEIVVSTLGKSVSLFTHEWHSFYQVDYQGNHNLLKEALASGVQRFVYTSIFASEASDQLPVGWSQELFSRELKQSGFSYTIIKPVGTFSGLHDLLIMGRWGLILTPGDGKPLTNPIHQQDLAAVCVQHLQQGPAVLPVGGPEIHSRQQTAELVCQLTRCRWHLNVPLWLVKPGLPLVRLFSRNLYHKMKQFVFITTHDMVAPSYGSLTLEDYLPVSIEY